MQQAACNPILISIPLLAGKQAELLLCFFSFFVLFLCYPLRISTHFVGSLVVFFFLKKKKKEKIKCSSTMRFFLLSRHSPNFLDSKINNMWAHFVFILFVLFLFRSIWCVTNSNCHRWDGLFFFLIFARYLHLFSIAFTVSDLKSPSKFSDTQKCTQRETE